MEALPPGWIMPDPIRLRPAPGYEYAGFWRRAVAYWIDGLLLGIPVALFALAVFGNTYPAFFSTPPIRFDPATRLYVTSPEFVAAISAFFGSLARTLVVSWIVQSLYYAICWSRLGASLGQKLLGVEVRTVQTGTWIGFWRGCLRAVGYLISGLFLDAGFIWAAFDSRKQGWHDKIAGTVVIRRSGQDSRAGPLVVILVIMGLLIASTVGVGAFGAALPRPGLIGSSPAPVPTVRPTPPGPSSAASGIAQAGSSSQPVPMEIWFGSSFDRTSLALSGRSTTVPRNKPLAFVAHLYSLFGAGDSVSVHMVAAGEDQVIDLFTFSAQGNLLGDTLPAAVVASSGTVRILILDEGGVTMATGWFTIQ